MLATVTTRLRTRDFQIAPQSGGSKAVWTLGPDGILFYSFYGRPQPALALEAIACAYGEDPRPTPRDAARRALAGKRALLILDGTEETDDLRAVLDVRGACGVLVTSRRRGDAVAERQDVQPLEPDWALVLLQAWGKTQAADETAAGAICKHVGRLPLAVRLVSRYLDHLMRVLTGCVEGERLGSGGARYCAG